MRFIKYIIPVFILFDNNIAHANDLYVNSDALKDAQFRLTECRSDNKSEKTCKFEQSEFIKEYQNAYSGDYLAQLNVGYMLLRGGSGSVQKNQLEACAWHTIAMRSKSPYIRPVEREQARITCTDPSPQYGQALERLVTEINHAIHAHGVHRVPVPEIDYDPKRDRDETNAGG